MRLFIAVPVSEEIRACVSELEHDLMKSRADFKWVDPANLHLTLRFFAAAAPESVPALGAAAEAAAASQTAFRFSLGALGAFDSLRHPRVLWVGIKEGAEALRRMADALDEELALRGIVREVRPFKAHLSIGRMRSPRNLENLRARMARWSDNSRLAQVHSPADRLVLMESRLSATGPTYLPLQEAPLRA